MIREKNFYVIIVKEENMNEKKPELEIKLSKEKFDEKKHLFTHPFDFVFYLCFRGKIGSAARTG
jgi:hypothetical protein